MTYNVSALQNASTVLDIVQYANDTTDMLLFNLFMIVIFIVLLMVLKKYDFEDTLLVASFFCFVISLLFRYAKLISFAYPIAFLTLTAFSALYLFVVKRRL